MNGLATLAQARAAVGLPRFHRERPSLPLVTQWCIHCQHQWPATPMTGQLSIACPACGLHSSIRRVPRP